MDQQPLNQSLERQSSERQPLESRPSEKRPLVTVVIPTLRRSHLVINAIKSVLSQTLRDIELIVVVDGPDDLVTVDVLEKIEDPRFRFMVLPVNMKSGEARNQGVKAAKAPWIAFLDDDDTWMPEKLERQLKVANQSDYAYPIVATRSITETRRGDFIWPRRLPRANEAIGDYLFVRSSMSQGEGMLLPSTLLVSRELMERVPIDSYWTTHEDYDWLLRADALEGVGVEFVPEPMITWHYHQSAEQPRLSHINDWKYSLNLIQTLKCLVSDRAYSAFVVTCVSPPAAAVGDWSAFWPLLKEFVVVGHARPLDYAFFLVTWLVPRDFRHRIRQLLNRQKTENSVAVN